MTKTQKRILAYLNQVESGTKVELMEKFSTGYYRNEAKHFGEILSRMVKSGSIIRLKQGVYTKGVNKIQESNSSQLGMFN